MDVVPENETVEVVAAGEKDAALGLFCHPMRKANVFFGLLPTRYQEQVDSDSGLPAQHRFSHRLLLCTRIGWI